VKLLADTIPPRLAELLQAMAERTLTSDEQRELNEILLSDRAARDVYRKYTDVHVGLQLMHSPASLDLPSGLEHAPRTARPVPAQVARRWWIGSVVAAALVLGAVAIWAWYAASVSAPPDPSVAESRLYVARVTFSEGAKWGAETTVLRENEWLTSGTIGLQAGRLELTFDAGAVMLVSGPAELAIRSAKDVYLARGAVRVRVPEPARGFLLRTPGGVVEDLGTEFAVDVADAQGTEVHVIQGAVRATLGSGSEDRSKRLDEQQAVRLDPDGGRFSPLDFAIAPSLALPEKMDTTPLPYVCYRFDEGMGTTVRDTGTFNTPYNGQLSNTRTEGAPPRRVPGKVGQGLLFDENMAVVETSYPGIGGNRARTVSFWVQVAPDAELKSAYAIVTWGLGKKGKRWQIGWNHNPHYGTVGAVRTDFWGGFVTGSTDLRDGQWHHVVSLFIGGQYADVATHIRHYVDGRLEAVSGSMRQRIDTELTHRESVPLIMGRKVDYERHRPGKYRTFQGLLDEVFIIDGALEPRQITDLLYHNDPYPPK